MKRLIQFSIYLYAFWLLLFLACRIFFVLYQWPLGDRIPLPSELGIAFIAGYKLDLSVATMFSLLQLLLANLFVFSTHPVFKRSLLCLTGLFVVAYVSMAISDAGLYREWNAKINIQALEHFKNPAEVFRTLSLKLILLFLLLVALFVIPFWFLFRKKVFPTLEADEQTSGKKRLAYGILFFVFSGGMGVILIRGSLLGMPMNQSIAYFSQHIFPNDIAVNPLYNLLQDMTIKNNIPGPEVYRFWKNEEARNIIQADFLQSGKSRTGFMKTTRPNLVIIFLESWSSDNIGVLGGLPNCTPRFDALSREGLLFTRSFSNAYVSDQGIPAVLSAYPSVSRVAITNQPAKVPNLPCISEELKKQDYYTSFLFGGELVYGNLRGYLFEKKFDQIRELADLDGFPTGRLGVHDEYTFPELLRMLRSQKEPFLTGFFTQSTHMPYDFVSTDGWQSQKDDPEKLYTESVHYSDLHLGRFFDSVKKENFYQNTLFLVISDHSHNSWKQRSPDDPEHHRIATLLLGGALKDEWKGKRWEEIVSHLDWAKTLLEEMQIPANRYPWSRNILDSVKSSSAWYIFYGGVGYICDSGYSASHQYNIKQVISSTGDSLASHYWRDKALAFQQLVYENLRLRK